MVFLMLAALLFSAFKLSPWPSALIIRYYFEKDAKETNLKLEKFVPKGVSEILNLKYDPKDQDAKLDVYYPSNTDQKLPVIVWVHGGGWVSGDKGQSSNYFKILAAKGYVVVAINYSIAPEKHYPLPVKQTMAALKYIEDHADQLFIDPDSIFLAGDSAGSHIALQTATIICEPEYAKLMGISPSINYSKMKGLILFCGAYAVENIDLNGDFGSFLKTVLWSYSGKKDFMNDPYFKTASVIDHVGANLPPTFISAGNGDPLLVHSEALAKRMSALGLETDTLFFSKNLMPKLPHEYQFNLDDEAGKTALNRSLVFLKKHQ